MPLRLVPPAQLEQLQRMACRFQHPDDPDHCEKLTAAPATVSLFGSRFETARSANAEHTSDYELNHVQVANELRAVREAKQNSDLVILSISTGQSGLIEPEANMSPSALERLARAAIDAGADLVVASGPSSLGPIEIYRPTAGPPRPILYGVGHLYDSSVGLVDSDQRVERDSIIVRSRVGADRLRLEIYPIERSGAANGAAGTPRLATAARGRLILERLQRLSSPFHTVIRTEPYRNSVRGVIEGGAAAAAAGPS
jgi:hypothetical protein